MSAPLIIRDQRDRADEQEVVVMLADFSFTPPEQVFAELRKSAPSAAAAPGMKPAPRAMPATTPMSGMKMGASSGAPDLNDVKYDAFLANDRTLADPEVVKVEPGGRVLLRIVNSSSMSAYHVDLGQLDGQLIAVDGFEVVPLTGRRFPIAAAQRLDIRAAIPREPAAYPVLAVLEGERNQTGIVLLAGRAPIAASSRACPGALRGSHARSGKPLARDRAADAAQGRSRSYTGTDGRDGRLRVVDQQCSLEQGRAAITDRGG